MAKEKNEKPPTPAMNDVLPQNLVSVGEQTADEDKKIYISQPVYRAIKKFAKDKIATESGGVLVGSVLPAFGKTNILVSGFIEAKFNHATSTTLTFTHETWAHFHKELEKKYPKHKIVGWIHTHPNFGIFLSENDKFIQNNFFKEDFQIAYVVDPIQRSEGFFHWKNGAIERSKGFYIYDKTGIKINSASFEEQQEESVGFHVAFKDILFGALIAMVLFLSVALIGAKSDLASLQKKYNIIISNYEMNLRALQQQVMTLQSSSASNMTSQQANQSTPEALINSTEQGTIGESGNEGGH